MKHATLCLLIKENFQQILLGYKKQGFGQGKYNGFGGKVKRKEKIYEAAIRELYEESKIKTYPEHIKKVAELNFKFPFVPKIKRYDQIVHVFLVYQWDGEPKESVEMKPYWFNINEIPYSNMWQDDRHWLPLILKDKLVKGNFVFDKDNESIKEMNLEEISSF